MTRPTVVATTSGGSSGAVSDTNAWFSVKP